MPEKEQYVGILLRMWVKTVVNVHTGCWEYQTSLSPQGQGKISVAYGHTELVHRVSYHIHKGVIPFGVMVRYTCDNPCCWNPAHPLLGTQYDNMADMLAHGRENRIPAHFGEDCSFAKLTQKQVDYIRAHYNPALRNGSKLARKFGVSKYTVSNIVLGKSWVTNAA